MMVPSCEEYTKIVWFSLLILLQHLLCDPSVPFPKMEVTFSMRRLNKLEDECKQYMGTIQRMNNQLQKQRENEVRSCMHVFYDVLDLLEFKNLHHSEIQSRSIQMSANSWTEREFIADLRGGEGVFFFFLFCPSLVYQVLFKLCCS